MLSTIGDEGLWTSPSYFVIDEKNHIYFLSEQHSKHIKNMWVNELASVVIENIDQNSFQFVGHVKILSLSKKNNELYQELVLLHRGSDLVRQDEVKLIQLIPEKIFLLGKDNKRKEIKKTKLLIAN